MRYGTVCKGISEYVKKKKTKTTQKLEKYQVSVLRYVTHIPTNKMWLFSHSLTCFKPVDNCIHAHTRENGPFFLNKRSKEIRYKFDSNQNMTFYRL